MKKGFTLIEVVVAAAVLVTALALGYRLLHFGRNSFDRGERQNNIQQNVRFASDLITREIQKASQVEILEELPESLDPDKRYIYVDYASGRLKMYSGGALNDALGSVNDDVEFTSLVFDKNPGMGDVLYFNIQADSGNQKYATDSQVQVLNLPPGASIDASSVSTGGTGKVLCYSFADNAKSLDFFAFYTTIEANAGLPEDRAVNKPETEFTIWYPSGTAFEGLVATFTYTGKSIKIGETPQVSGVTANDFTETVIYTIEAEDGSKIDYKVTLKADSQRPEASNVRIEVINSDPEIIVPFESSTLRGKYTYVSNDNGPEGASKYEWRVADTEDGTYTKIAGESSITLMPAGLAGKWVKFGVSPVSAAGTEGLYYYSNPKQIFPDEGNLFWKHFINDVYTMRLPEEEIPDDFVCKVYQRKDYMVESVMNPNQTDLNLTISNGDDSSKSIVTNGGAHIFKQITANYLSENADFQSYTITVDAQVMGGSGYGVLLNGIIDKSNNNRDTGYMFQFDPGAGGFLVRKIVNGSHDPTKTYGLVSNGKYAPSDIRNDKFLWPGSNDQSNTTDWRKPYKTEIMVQIQNNGDLIFKVTIIDESGNRSNEMWFGDFGTYTLRLYDKFGRDTGSTKTFTGSSMPSYFTVDPSGPWLGLRTWNRESGSYNTLFQEITISDGFSMNITSVEFISREKIIVRFDQELSDFTDKNRIKYGAVGVTDARIINTPDFGQALLITLPSPVLESIARNGTTEMLNLYRGSVRRIYAGDVRIDNGLEHVISGDVTGPIIESVTMVSGNNRKARITFSEPVDPDSAVNQDNYSISGNTITAWELSSANTVTITCSKNININNQKLSVHSVKDIFGNTMNDMNNISIPYIQ